MPKKIAKQLRCQVAHGIKERAITQLIIYLIFFSGETTQTRFGEQCHKKEIHASVPKITRQIGNASEQVLNSGTKEYNGQLTTRNDLVILSTEVPFPEKTKQIHNPHSMRKSLQQKQAGFLSSFMAYYTTIMLIFLIGRRHSTKQNL